MYFITNGWILKRHDNNLIKCHHLLWSRDSSILHICTGIRGHYGNYSTIQTILRLSFCIATMVSSIFLIFVAYDPTRSAPCISLPWPPGCFTQPDTWPENEVLSLALLRGRHLAADDVVVLQFGNLHKFQVWKKQPRGKW